MKKTAAVLFLLILSTHIIAQNWKGSTKVTAFDRAKDDRFGTSVAIDGNYAIVGAMRDDKDANGKNPIANAGSAYIYKKDSLNNWTLFQKIVPSDRGPNAMFGNDVDIYENFIIVGAYYRTTDSAGKNYLYDAGAAYIFELDSSNHWKQIEKLSASDREATDIFGESVTISREFAIVGAPLESHDASGTNLKKEAGSAYVFKRFSNGSWSEVAKLVSSDRQAGDRFGVSVDIDHDQLVVGAYWEDHNSNGNNSKSKAGSVYIFEKNSSGNWLEKQKLVAIDRDVNDEFGEDAALSENYLVVGARWESEDETGKNTLTNSGSAYVFLKDSNTGTWTQSQKLVANDRSAKNIFGNSVSVASGKIAIGTPSNSTDEFGQNKLDESGATYIFEKNNKNIWIQTQKIVSNDRDAQDNFGWAVAVSDQNVICGAYHEDHDSSGTNFIDDAGSAYFFYNCASNTETTISSCFNFISPTGKVWTLSGIYYDTLQNINGCDSFVKYNLSIIRIDTSLTLKKTSLSSNDSNASYQWYNCDSNLLISGEKGQTFEPTTKGNYAVILTKGACIDTSECYAFTPLNTNHISKEYNVKLYPNPTSGSITLSIDKPYKNTALILRNIMGQELKRIPLRNSKTGLLLNVPNGIYFIEILEDTKVLYRSKIIKK